MFKNYRKPTAIFLSVGVVLFLSACQTDAAKNPSQQESLESVSIEQDTAAQTSTSISDAIEQVAVYAILAQTIFLLEQLTKIKLKKQ